MNSKDFLAFLQANAFSQDGATIRTAFDILKQASRFNQRRTAVMFLPGQKVRFDAKHRGIVTGLVIKVNATTLKVQQDESRIVWTVAPSLCEKLA